MAEGGQGGFDCLLEFLLAVTVDREGEHEVAHAIGDDDDRKVGMQAGPELGTRVAAVVGRAEDSEHAAQGRADKSADEDEAQCEGPAQGDEDGE